MTACQQLLHGSGGGPVGNLGSIAVNSNGSGVSASATFRTDGGITYGFTSGTATGPTAWFTPVSGTPGNGYWIRFTVTSGSITTNPAPTFTQLSSNITLTQTTVGVQTRNGTATIEISSSSGGSPVVASGSVNLSIN